MQKICTIRESLFANRSPIDLMGTYEIAFPHPSRGNLLGIYRDARTESAFANGIEDARFSVFNFLRFGAAYDDVDVAARSLHRRTTT